MSSLERESETGQMPDLSSLKQMVGVKKVLESLVGQGKPLDRETVLNVLESQQLVLDGTKGFKGKALVLQGIIEEIRGHEEVKVELILAAIGVNVSNDKDKHGGLKTWFRHGK